MPAGTELISINNIPIDNIKRKLFQYIVSDGAIQTGKYWILSNNFWFYYAIVYGQQSVFTIACKLTGGGVKTITLSTCTRSDNTCGHDEVKPREKLRVSYENKNVALLTIKSFGNDVVSQAGEDYTHFLQATFKKIKDKKIKKLIIDSGAMEEDGMIMVRSFILI